MTQYLLSVHGLDGQYDTPLEDMQASFEAVDAFNQKIMASGQWVFGGGLAAADHRHRGRQHRGQERRHRRALPRGQGALGGFWVHRGHRPRRRPALAAEASQACQGPVEVRPVPGRARVLTGCRCTSRTCPPMSRRSSGSSARTPDERWRPWSASSATSTSPRKRSRTPSSWRWSSGPSRACRPLPTAGSSPPPATGASTTSAASPPATPASTRPCACSTPTNCPRRPARWPTTSSG